MNKEEEVSIITNNTPPEVKVLNNNNTFNKLKNIQNLLKKESALKELCKKIKIYNLQLFKQEKKQIEKLKSNAKKSIKQNQK